MMALRFFVEPQYLKDMLVLVVIKAALGSTGVSTR
jgi:hypothetical protein